MGTVFGDPYNVETGGKDPRGLSTFGGNAQTKDASGRVVASSAATAANRYRRMGEESNAREGVGLQYGGAEGAFGRAGEDRHAAAGARQAQINSLNLAGSAAVGAQPSQAELLGRGMIDQSLQSQLAGASSAKGGPLAQATAQRGAQQMGAATRQQGMGQLSAMRADEMARARSEFAGQAGALRGQDYQGVGLSQQEAAQRAQMAQAQGIQDAEQRRLNQQREMGFEGMGYGVQEGEANRGVQLSQQEQGRWKAQMEANQAASRASEGMWGKVADVGGKLLGGALGFSDDRTKDYLPMRAMGGPVRSGLQYGVGEEGPEIFSTGPMAEGPSEGPAEASFAGAGGMLGGSPMGELKAHSAAATRFARNPTSAGGREHGGKVEAGKTYEVGEAGKEKFVAVRRNALEGAVRGTVEAAARDSALEKSRYAGEAEDFDNPEFDPAMPEDAPNPRSQKLTASTPVQVHIEEAAAGAKSPEETLRKGTPKSFRRDTRAEQKQMWDQAKDAYYAKLSKEADAEIAAMQRNLAYGPAAKRLAGGSPETDYETELTSGAEGTYSRDFGPEKGRDYDLRGAFASGVTEGQPSTFELDDGSFSFPGHLPDTFKKPSHETFSNESMYAPYEPEKAGRWEGDRFIPRITPDETGEDSEDADYTELAMLDKSDLPRRREGGAVDEKRRYLVAEDGKERYRGADGDTFMVGMDGPEIFTAPADGEIIPNPATRDLGDSDTAGFMTRDERPVDLGELTDDDDPDFDERERDVQDIKGWRSNRGDPQFERMLDDRQEQEQFNAKKDKAPQWLEDEELKRRIKADEDAYALSARAPLTDRERGIEEEKPRGAGKRSRPARDGDHWATIGRALRSYSDDSTKLNVPSRAAINQTPRAARRMTSDDAAKKAAFMDGAKAQSRKMESFEREQPPLTKDEKFRRSDDYMREQVERGKGRKVEPIVHPAVPMGEERRPAPTAAMQQDANRKGTGFTYAYKDAFRPPEQEPGELNYGFSANKLEQNPLTATAVKRDQRGLRQVDVPKLVKTNTAGIASLQGQIDDMNRRNRGLRYG